MFSCKKLYDAQRHVAAHGRHDERNLGQTMGLWRFVSESSQMLRPRKSREVTNLRLGLGAAEVATGCARWDSRLLIGKTDSVAEVLSSAIERFGTGSYYGPMSAARMQHDPRTSRPLCGHHVRFHPTAKEEPVWYGVCCGDFSKQDVLGEYGLACRIRWFDHSYTDTWNGKSTAFYQLTEASQEQLFDCMQDWGHLLVHDKESGLFVDPGTEVEVTDEDREPNEQYGHPDNPQWMQEVTTQPDGDGEGPSREELLVFEAVYPRSLLYLVSPRGVPEMPASCGKQSKDPSVQCKWTAPYADGIRRLPVVTPEGPLFLTPVRYHCSTHGGTVTSGSKGESKNDCDPYSLNVVYHRLGDMRYTTEAITTLQGTYVDGLTVAGCRRRLLDSWLARGLRALTRVKQTQRELGLRSDKLQAGARAVLALADFVPSDNSICELMLVLYEKLVKPQLPRYDAYVCAFDGQMMRIDGTFKSASVVRAYGPAELGRRNQGESKGARVVKTVAGCVLVAVGLEGLCLTTPRLVRTENGESISQLAKYVMRKRRDVLGSTSAPAAMVTDSIRQHKKLLWKAVTEVYPEMEASIKEGRMEQDDAVLMLQDIPHREWVFTRQAAVPKHHPDRADYIAAVKEVFHRLRVPHSEDQSRKGEEVMQEWKRTWKLHTQMVVGERQLTETGLKGHIRRSLLRSANSTPVDDGLTKLFIEKTGCAAVNCEYLRMYIPQRTFVRTARRLLISETAVQELFPKQGYGDADEFLLHLQGVNRFYKEVRSQAHREAPGTVANNLGQPKHRKQKGLRSSRKRHHDHTLLEVAEVPQETEGIANKRMVEEALVACSNEAVTKPHPTSTHPKRTHRWW